MRTIARETAFQIVLRNCSKEVGGKVSICVILMKGEYMQSSTYFLQKVAASFVKIQHDNYVLGIKVIIMGKLRLRVGLVN